MSLELRNPYHHHRIHVCCQSYQSLLLYMTLPKFCWKIFTQFSSRFGIPRPNLVTEPNIHRTPISTSFLNFISKKEYGYCLITVKSIGSPPSIHWPFSSCKRNRYESFPNHTVLQTRRSFGDLVKPARCLGLGWIIGKWRIVGKGFVVLVFVFGCRYGVSERFRGLGRVVSFRISVCGVFFSFLTSWRGGFGGYGLLSGLLGCVWWTYLGMVYRWEELLVWIYIVMRWFVLWVWWYCDGVCCLWLERAMHLWVWISCGSGMWSGMMRRVNSRGEEVCRLGGMRMSSLFFDTGRRKASGDGAWLEWSWCLTTLGPLASLNSLWQLCLMVTGVSKPLLQASGGWDEGVVVCGRHISLCFLPCPASHHTRNEGVICDWNLNAFYEPIAWSNPRHTSHLKYPFKQVLGKGER